MFPYHYTSLGSFACKKKEQRFEQKKSDLLKYSRIVPTESLQTEMACLEQEIENTEKIHVDFLNLTKQNWLAETLIDNFPSAILMISIWMLSIKHQKLGLFLDDTFKEFISVNYQIVVGILTSKSALSALFSALNIRYVYFINSLSIHKPIKDQLNPKCLYFRNSKRLPITQSFSGMLIQPLAAIFLFAPKVGLVAMSLSAYPWVFPFCMLAEFGLIILYNRIFYGQFAGNYKKI